jgi:hypothetical protein
MRRVIYTGNFSINWDYFQGVQGWHIKNMWAMYNYGKRHGADFRVIDNSNRLMQSFYDSCMEYSNGKIGGWGIGAFSSLFALKDFIRGDYDEFCWLDLDICIKKTDISIFGALNKGCLTVESYKVIHDSENTKKTFVQDFFNLEHTRWCGTGVVLLDKPTAWKIFNFLEEKYYVYLDSCFAQELCDFLMRADYLINDEHIFEGIINSDIVPTVNIPGEYRPHIVYPGDIADPTMDVWGFHFAGTTKNQIESFQL